MNPAVIVAQPAADPAQAFTAPRTAHVMRGAMPTAGQLPPLVLDSARVFTASQSKHVAQAVSEATAASGCRIQVVTTRGAQSRWRLAHLASPNVDARLVLDADTGSASYHAAAKAACVANFASGGEDIKPYILQGLEPGEVAKADIKTAEAIELAAKSGANYVDTPLVTLATTGVGMAVVTNSDYLLSPLKEADDRYWADPPREVKLAALYIVLSILGALAAPVGAWFGVRYCQYRRLVYGSNRSINMSDEYIGLCVERYDALNEAFLDSTTNSLRALRRRMLDTGKALEWREAWRTCEAEIASLAKRHALLAATSENAEPEDVKDARNKLASDSSAFIAALESRRIALSPRLTPAIKAEIMGTASAASPRMPTEISARVRDIARGIELAEGALTEGMVDESFTLSEMRKRYLPDTIDVFEKAVVHSPAEAVREVDRQLATIESALGDVATAIASNESAALLANGRFLSERFH